MSLRSPSRASRSFRVVGGWSIALAVAAVASPALAQQAAPADATPDASGTPEVENSPFTFAGEVKSDGTLVNSGASDQDYPVLKLSKGTRLTVVGIRNDWLKIVPPEGAFCLIPQAYVNRRGNGNVGRVDMKATIRIGSALTQAKHKVPMQLDPGTEVQILGEVDEYYKITPPEGVYVYVNKAFVVPVKRLDENAGAANASMAAAPAGDATSSAEASGNAAATTAADSGVAMTQTPANPLPGAPNGDRFTVRGSSDDAAATTKPTADLATADQVRELQEKLVALEDRFGAASKQEITEQPVAELMTDYQALLDNPALPPNARRVAEYRVQTLKLRKETLAQYLATKQMQAEIAKKQDALRDEQAKLQQEVAENSVKRYAAIGLLKSSTLRAGDQALYRLIDPASGRTIVYVRPAAGQGIGPGLDQFVAVKGTVVTDDAMRITYVTPEAFEAADPRQVNRKIFAEYAPPSMATANLTSTDGQ